MGYSKAETKPTTYRSDLIALTGETGVGKSAVVRILKETLLKEMYFISTGDLMRMAADEHGMTPEQFAVYNSEHSEQGYDKNFDMFVSLMCKEKKNLFVQTRVPHSLPEAFHVLLMCPLQIRAERRQKDKEFNHLSISEVARMIEQRDKDDRARFEVLYPGYRWNKLDFDLVVDTSKNHPEEIANIISVRHAWWVSYVDERKKIRV